MYRHWEALIEPILSNLQPTSIIEVGCGEGHNTRNLLEYCIRNNAVLHAIDPAPSFALAEWAQLHSKHLIFYRALSLNVLGGIDPADVVLLDGDHNWYTVYNELRLIDKVCTEKGHPFPVVMLHDVGWPYGRRDMYYNPEVIPSAFLKPFAKKGMVPTSADLVSDGGLNPNYNNAVYENNLQNGVLTAVEDFLSDNPGRFQFVAVPAFNGFGILYSREILQEKTAFADFIAQLPGSSLLNRLMVQLERSRVQSQIQALDLSKALREKTETIAKLQADLLQLEQALASEKEARLLETERESLNAERTAVEARLRECESELERVKREYSAIANELQAVQAQLRSLHQAADRDKDQLSTAAATLARAKDMLSQAYMDIDFLVDVASKLDAAVTAIANSTRWKVGNRIVSLVARALGRKMEPLATDYARKVADRFRDWKQRNAASGNRASDLRWTLESPQRYSAATVIAPVEVSVTDLTKPIIYQLTPGETRNPVFTGPARLLRKKGWDFRFSTDFREIREGVAHANRPVVLHFHQMEPLYRSTDRASSEQKLRNLLGFMTEQHRCGVALVHTLHNRRPHDGKDLDLDNQVSRAISSFFSRVIVLGEKARPVAEALVAPDKVRVVRHPHYIGVYGAPVSKHEARAQLAIPEKDFVFLSLGDMKPYKGHSLIMDAFIKARLDHARLMVVGGHAPSLDYVRELEKRAETGPRGRIRVVARPVEDELMSTWLGAADVAVYGFGDMLVSGSVLLALSYGLPVIAPDVGCLSEYVRDRENGFLYRVGDRHHLTEAMGLVAKSSLPAADQVIASVRDLDPERLADELGRVYVEAAKERSSR